MAANPLLEPLSPEQTALLRVIFQSFVTTGDWPIWQYADLHLDRRGIDAAQVLASLPQVGERGPVGPSYGLIWREDSHMQPMAGKRIALTVAGLRHLPEAAPYAAAFLTAIRHLVDQQRQLVPSPSEVVEATVKRAAIEDVMLTASMRGDCAAPTDAAMDKLRLILGKEPFLYSVVIRPNSADWEIRVPAILREYRGVETVDDYLDRVVHLVAPDKEEWAPLRGDAPGIPSAAGYLDAVWENRTGAHLFAWFDPASIARFTQPCTGEDSFNSLMSALADVLAQVVLPGKTRPPQRGALEEVRKYLAGALDAEAAARASTAIDTLIRLRHVRVNSQHSDKRARAVTTFQELGLPYPPVNWPQTWARVAGMAKAALDAIREEVHAGIQ